MKARYVTAGADREYVVVDTVTGRPVPKLTGLDHPHSTREAAQAEADHLNKAYEKATST